MGTITGVGGGVLRDITVMQTPSILRKRIYAVASILGAILYWTCLRYGVPQEVSWALAMVFIVAIRICATVFHWNMPHVPTPDESLDKTEQCEEKELIR